MISKKPKKSIKDREEDLNNGLTDSQRLKNIQIYMLRALIYAYGEDEDEVLITNSKDMGRHDFMKMDAIHYCMKQIGDNYNGLRNLTTSKYSDLPWFSIYACGTIWEWPEEFEDYYSKVFYYCVERLGNIISIESGKKVINKPLVQEEWLLEFGFKSPTKSATTSPSNQHLKVPNSNSEKIKSFRLSNSVWQVKKR